MKTFDEVAKVNPSKKKEEPKPIKSDAKINVTSGGQGSLDSRIVMNPAISVGEEEGQRISEVYEPVLTLDDLLEVFDGDLTDVDEYDIEGELNEAISVSARYKKRITIRRYKNKIAIARRRSTSRRASQRVIQKRAKRMAISQTKRKFSHGRSSKKLSFSERARIEAIVKRRRPAVSRLSRRLVRTVRKNETRRLHNSFEYEFQNVNVLFEAFQELYEMASTDLITLAVGKRCTVSITKRAKKEWDKGAAIQDTAKVMNAISRLSDHGVEGIDSSVLKSEGRHQAVGIHSKKPPSFIVWAFRGAQLRCYGGFVDGDKHFVITGIMIKKSNKVSGGSGLSDAPLVNAATDLAQYYVEPKKK